jgi:hypothetical protein
MMEEILVEPGWPQDIKPADLIDLREAIAELDPGFQVAIAYEDQKGAGVTFWEVVFIWLPASAVGPLILEKALDVGVNWLQRRFDHPHSERRPKSLHILGPNGEVLRTVNIERRDATPEELQGSDDEPRRQRPTRRYEES